MKRVVLILFLSGLMAGLFAQTKSTAKPKRAAIDTSKFVLVEGGTFKMGTDKPVETAEGPAHTVTVKSFYLAKTETTFEDYDKFWLATNKDTIPFGNWGRGKQPAIYVSWLDAVAYCNWLSEKEKLSKYYKIDNQTVKTLDTAKGYRLPTEAEWEFAARGGNKSKGTVFAGGDVVGEVGWYIDNSNSQPHPVKQKTPNELGLYDMTGNVWEWVWDWFDGGYYHVSPEVDPRGPAVGSYRVMRGGAWYNYGNYATVYTRQNNHVGFRQNSVGFRVARSYFK
jgi:sulfatase modifying factor 1